MPIYEYRCPNGHTNEASRTYQDRMTLLTCKTCARPARYIISAPKLDYIHMGVDTNMGTAADKWARMHEET